MSSYCVVSLQMIDWTPQVYKTMGELPENMPKDLKDHIASENKYLGSIPEVSVWRCSGSAHTQKNSSFGHRATKARLRLS